MKKISNVSRAMAIAAVCLGSGLGSFAQTIVPVTDLSTNGDGSLVIPAVSSSSLSVSNITVSAAGTSSGVAGLNYYTDAGGGGSWDGSPGQTFTVPNTANLVITNLSVRTDNQGGSTGAAQTYWLRIFAVSGVNATLVASYQSDPSFSFTPGDWLQWNNLLVPVSAAGTYAYTLARDSSGSGWCRVYSIGSNPYVGGQVCAIRAAGGANSVTYGTSGTEDGNFVINLAVNPAPVPTTPQLSANTVYAGSPVTISEISGGAAPLYYQWITDGGSGGSLTNIPGSTSTNLTVIPPDTGSTYTIQYAVIVTNYAGSVTSSVATLTVYAATVPLLTQDISPGFNSIPVYAYANASVTFNAGFDGTKPIGYMWQADTGSGFSTLTVTTNATLTLSNLALAATGSYRVQATNSIGSSNSSTALLAILADPAAPDASQKYPYAVFTNNPVGYWRLGETTNPATSSMQAYDYSGHYLCGTYGAGAQVNQAGPQPALYPGFAADNIGANFINNAAGSYVTVPSLDLNTNTVTISMWINPSSVVGSYWGLFTWINGSDKAGFGFGPTVDGNGMAELGYVWNTNSSATWGWSSGLHPVAGQWSFVTLVITPTNSTIYLYTDSGSGAALLKSVQNITNGPESFHGGTIRIGTDSYDGRNFQGLIDEVSVFNRSLSEAEVQHLFLTALGTTAVAPVIGIQPPASINTYAGQTFNITASASGIPTPTFQWQAGVTGSGIFNNLSNGGHVSGATSSTLTLANTTLADALDYQLVAANSLGSATSTVCTVMLAPVPNNGQWTANFAIINGYNGTSTTPYAGRGILGAGTKWNKLQTGATVPAYNTFRSTAPVYQDNGSTVNNITVELLNDYNWGWGNGAGTGTIPLFGPYAEVYGNDLQFANIPNGTYNLAIYGVDGNYQDQGFISTVNGDVRSVTGGRIDYFVPGVNSVLYTNVQVTGGKLIANLTNNIVDNPSQGAGAFNGAQLQLVQASGNPAQISSVTVSGGNVVIKGTCPDVGQAYRILGTTNLALPVVSWTTVASSTYTSTSFSNSIPINLTNPQDFYRVVEP